jgi:hypothetical protein
VLTQTPSPAVLPKGGAFLWAVLATDDQFSTIADISDSELCSTNLTAISFAAKQLGFANETMADVIVTSWSASGSVSQATYLHYLFVSCTNLDLELDVDYHFVNPGGEELSSGEIPYKKLSLGLLLAWASIAGVILLNLAVVRCLWRSEPLPPLEGLSPLIDPSWLNLSPVRGLHWALLAVPVLSLINNGITRAYFLDASETGHYNNVAGIAGLMAGVMEAAALLTIILLLARGWQITRLSLDRNETRHVFFVVVIFCVGSAAFQLVGGLFFMFLLVLTYVLMLRYVFASVSWKLRLLGAFRLYSRRWFGALPPGDGLADDRAAGANSLLAVEEDDYQGDWLSRGRRGGRADAESGDADRAAIRNNTVYVADGRASPPVVPAGPTAGAANAVAPASQAYTIAVRPPPAVATVGSATTTAAAPPVAGAVQHASGSGRDSDVERGERRSLMTSAEHSDDAAEDGVELAELESIVPPSYAASATHAGSPDGAGTAIAMLATVGTAHAPHPVPPPGAGPRAWFSRARAAIGDPSQVPEGTLTTRQMSTLRYFRLAIVLFLFAEMLVSACSVGRRIFGVAARCLGELAGNCPTSVMGPVGAMLLMQTAESSV